MGSAYAQRGTSGGSAYAQRGTTRMPYHGPAGSAGTRMPYHGGTPTAPKKSGGNFFSHLGGDIVHALENIPAGVVHTVEHPVGTAKAIGKSYKQTYGPLFSGHFGKFFHGIEAHPLGPILDVATLLTAGAGGVARIGSILGKAGAVSSASRLARLADATHLTVPDVAELAGQTGERIPVKLSSTNPLIRARQTLTNHMMNRLPENLPMVGAIPRGLKSLQTGPARAGARLGLESQPFAQSFARLSKTERQAWHLSARGVTPAAYKAHLLAQPGFKSPAMMKVLDNPKLAQLVEKPTPKLTDALTKGRALSERMTEAKVGAGHISEQSAAESPYHLLRLINGAKVNTEHTPTTSGRVEQTRTYPGKETTTTRPVTAEEAQARLSELDSQYNEMVNHVAEAVQPHDNPRAVTLQRNFINSRVGKGKFIGTKKQPSVANEARAIADSKIREAIQTNPDHPIAQKAAAILSEREHLQNELNAHAEQAFAAPNEQRLSEIRRRQKELEGEAQREIDAGTQGSPASQERFREILRLFREQDDIVRGKIGAADFGTVTHTAAGKPRSVHLAARAATSAAHHPTIVDAPGREIPVLAKELEQAGKTQPFYVPDSADTGAGRMGRYRSKPSGIAEPMRRGSTRMNTGKLANRGQLALNENALLKEFVRFKNDTEASLLHDEIVKHAARLPEGEAIPAGYEHLKLNPGEASAPYTERVGGQFEHGLNEPGLADRFLAKANEPETHALAKDGSGDRLVVPSSVRDILTKNARTTHGVLHALTYGAPTSVWKALVLGLRPGFFGNITIGNSILGALQMAPGYHGVAGWLNQVTPGMHHLFGSKLEKQTMKEVFPEHARGMGTFGHSMGYTSNRGVSMGRRAVQGVMPATIVYETVLRRAMAEGWAKAMPEVRAAMKDHGGDINAALRQVAAHHPQVINDISRRIDDALGNYRDYNKFEEGLRQWVPFYGWDRHIVRSVARIAKERPGRLDALVQEGAYGKKLNDKNIGPLPSFLQGAIKLPGLPKFMGPLDGRTPLLSTRSLNPFNTAAELTKMGGDLFSGQAGSHGSELSAGLNPIIQGLVEQITGRSLLTNGAMPKGGPNAGVLGNVARNIVASVPQARLLDALLHAQKTKPGALYRKDLQTQLAAFLGAPVKKTNLSAAAQLAAKEGKPRR